MFRFARARAKTPTDVASRGKWYLWIRNPWLMARARRTKKQKQNVRFRGEVKCSSATDRCRFAIHFEFAAAKRMEYLIHFGDVFRWRGRPSSENRILHWFGPVALKSTAQFHEGCEDKRNWRLNDRGSMQGANSSARQSIYPSDNWKLIGANWFLIIFLIQYFCIRCAHQAGYWIQSLRSPGPTTLRWRQKCRWSTFLSRLRVRFDLQNVLCFPFSGRLRQCQVDRALSERTRPPNPMRTAVDRREHNGLSAKKNTIATNDISMTFRCQFIICIWLLWLAKRMKAAARNTFSLKWNSCKRISFRTSLQCAVRTRAHAHTCLLQNPLHPMECGLRSECCLRETQNQPANKRRMKKKTRRLLFRL